MQLDQFGRPIEQAGQNKPRSTEGCGCFAWGCLSLIVFTVGGTILLLFFGSRFLNRMIDSYTMSEPANLPQVNIEPGQYSSVDYKIESFLEAINRGEQPAPLVLSEQEVNAYVSNEPFLNGHVYVSLEDGEAKIQMSFPLDEFGYQGRYLNAIGWFDVAVANGQLVAHLKNAEVAGKTIPEEQMKFIRAENLAKNLGREDPDVYLLMQKLDSIEITDRQITLTPR